VSFTRNKTIRNIAHLRLLLRVPCEEEEEEEEEEALFDSSDPGVMVEDDKEDGHTGLFWGKVDNRKAKTLH
jgi:hypothetical protein